MTIHGPLIRYAGCPFTPNGYGTEARVALRYLHRAGYNLALQPRDSGPRLTLDKADAAAFGIMTNRTGEGRPAMEIHHLPTHLIEPDPDVPVRVARTMVEADALRRNWGDYCKRMTEVWVPSTFCAEVFAGSGLDPDRLRVVPIGVDTRIFHPRAAGGSGAAGFKFLSVLTWQWRKGWDILLKAYYEEFGPGEDVSLILKVVSPGAHAERRRARALETVRGFVQERLGHDFSRAPPVLIIQETMSERDLAALYAMCDAFVLASRGEGWGRPYLEAMASGLPTIGTGWGGNLDFMTPDNSYLIDVECLEPVRAGTTRVIGPEARWARPSLGHLRQLMRHVFTRPAEALTRAANARREALAYWDFTVTGRSLAREIDRLAFSSSARVGAGPAE